MSPPAVNLASEGKFSKINWGGLTVKDITEKDEAGYTLLHHVASAGLMQNIPKHLQDKKYWSETPDGTTIYMLALQRPYPNWWVDKNDLTEKEILKRNQLGESFLSLAIKTSLNISKLIPHKSLSPRVLLTNYKDGDKIIHLLARENGIRNLPKKLLYEELLSTPGHNGHTVYHTLASMGKLGSLPTKLLTKKALTQQSKHGATALLFMAQYEPDIIPKELLTTTFILKEQFGGTPLHSWAKGHLWMNIPLEFITKETLQAKREPPLLNCIINQYAENRFTYKDDKDTLEKMDKIFHKCLKLANIKGLEALIKPIETKELGFILPPNMGPVSSMIKKSIMKRKILSKINRKKAYIEI
jgi:hypothetical protein